MKKPLALVSALLLCINLCAPALAVPDGNAGVLPVTPVFTFSSGVGAWFSECTVHTDGTFEGYSQDIDMGVTGDGFPNGTVYTSTFRGAFHQITQVDAYTWSMKVASLTTEEAPGNERIEDGVRYIAVAAVGIPDVGGEVLLYLPGHDRASLPESFLWWTGSGDTDSPQIDYYGLYNVEEGFGFDSAGSQTAPEETAPEETAPEESTPPEGELEVHSGPEMPFIWNVIVAVAFMVLASAVVVLAVFLVRKIKAARQAGSTPPPADPPAQPPREP